MKKQKKKSRVSEFFETVGLALSIIWLSPILLFESIKESLEKRKKKKEPKPEPTKFVCSQCGETFLVGDDGKDVYVQGVEGDYLKPRECPHCHCRKTFPEGADSGVYEKLWDMEDLSFFIYDMERKVLPSSAIDKGLKEYKCSECGTVFKAHDIGSHLSQFSFLSRCPHCHGIKTMPACERQQNLYEPLWMMLEAAEKSKTVVDLSKILKGVGF